MRFLRQRLGGFAFLVSPFGIPAIADWFMDRLCSLLDLLNAEQEYHNARFENIDSAHELQKLAVECWYQSGRLGEVFELDLQPRQGVQAMMQRAAR